MKPFADTVPVWRSALADLGLGRHGNPPSLRLTTLNIAAPAYVLRLRLARAKSTPSHCFCSGLFVCFVCRGGALVSGQPASAEHAWAGRFWADQAACGRGTGARTLGVRMQEKARS